MMCNLSDTMAHIVENVLRTIHERLLELSSSEFKGERPKAFEVHLFDELVLYMKYYNKESMNIAKLFGYKNYYRASVGSPNCLIIKSTNILVKS